MSEFGPDAIADKMELISEEDDQRAVIAGIKKVADEGTDIKEVGRILMLLAKCGMDAIEKVALQSIEALKKDPSSIDAVRAALGKYVA